MEVNKENLVDVLANVARTMHEHQKVLSLPPEGMRNVVALLYILNSEFDLGMDFHFNSDDELNLTFKPKEGGTEQ